jgi:hypothetical protein
MDYLARKSECPLRHEHQGTGVPSLGASNRSCLWTEMIKDFSIMTLHLGRPDHLDSMVADRMELDIQLRIARAKNGYRARRVIAAILTIGALVFFPSEIRAADARDRLSRIARTSIIADSAELGRLLKKKLYVTRDDVARYLFLTNGNDGDRSAALYRAIGKAGSLQGSYWVTATEASTALDRCIPYEGQEEPYVDPKSVVVQRYDAPLPASTAQAVHELWLAVLERS